MKALMAPTSLVWFAHHEMRLAWRDATMMMRGGRRGRGIWAAIAMAMFLVVLHMIAYAALRHATVALLHPDKAVFVMVTGSAFLSWTLSMSQAMETVTRSFYARADLDLILSSPATARRLFAIRIGANAVTTIAMALILVGSVIDAAAFLCGPRFLLGYGVLVALGMTAVAAAVGATALLFRVVGPKRTRLLAQIVAATVGAGFVVGIQAATIVSLGSLSRTALFQSPAWIAAAPNLASPIWLPARATLGDPVALAFTLAGAIAMLAITIVVASRVFARTAMVVAGLPDGRTRVPARVGTFRLRSQRQAHRAKEWTLLRRDPWLVSQSLMQVLYLLPPALLLWRDFDAPGDGLVVLVPILVMAAGQLAGGLAWLAISGEDAPDLVATAPLVARAILRAKIEAVLIAVALPILPLALALALVAPMAAATTIVGAGLAAAGASAIQLFFKSQAKRSNFRRRQTSSRIATFAEAFLSICVAAGAGLVAAGYGLFAIIPATGAVAILFAARGLAGPPQPAV